MKQVSLIALAAALSLGVSGAQASDLYNGASTKDDGGYQVYRNWNGLWVAALGGYQMSRNEVTGRADWDKDKSDPGFAQLVIDGLADGGLTGEAQVGFDHEVVANRITLGVFAGYNISDASFETDFSSSALNSNFSVLSFEQDWGGVLGGRVGFIKSQDTAFFLGAGWAFGEMSPVNSDFKGVNDFLADQDTDLSGWFVQAEMETRVREVSDNLKLKMLVRYTDYGDMNLANGTDCGGSCSYSIDMSRDRVDALVGLSYTLGGIGN